MANETRHAPPGVLHKVTLVVWTRTDPRTEDPLLRDPLKTLHHMEERGDAYVSKAHSYPMNPGEVIRDDDWDENEFFDEPAKEGDDG